MASRWYYLGAALEASLCAVMPCWALFNGKSAAGWGYAGIVYIHIYIVIYIYIHIHICIHADFYCGAC